MTIILDGHLLSHPKDNKKSLPRYTGQCIGPRTFRYKTTQRLLSISSRKNSFRNYPQINKWILSLPSLPPPIPSPPTTSQVVRATMLIASSPKCVRLRAFSPVILFVSRDMLCSVFELILTDFFFFCTERREWLLNFTVHGIDIPRHYDYYYFRRRIGLDRGWQGTVLAACYEFHL